MTPTKQNPAQLYPNMLPIIGATAHTIMAQDSTTTALSCLLLTDSDKEDLNQLAQSLPKQIIGSCDVLNFTEFREIGFSQRYDLAVMVINPAAVLAEYSDIVVMCRDLSARHCLIFAPSLQNLSAFGFAKVGLWENTDYTAWQFNLFDYKQLPDWFNSRFWANPENWNKFRW